VPDSPPRWQPFFDAYRSDLARGIEWLLVARLAVLLGCLSMLLIYEEGAPRIFPSAYVVLVAASAIAVGYLLAYRRLALDLEQFVVLQIALDVLVVTCLVYTTGYNVGFWLLYFATILSASLLVSERAGIVVASAATVAHAIVALVYLVAAQLGSTPPFLTAELLRSADMRWGAFVANVVLPGAGFHFVAVLAALLPYRMTRVRILYDEILDSMREGLVAIDNVGKIVFVNREARRLLNWEGVGRMVGRRFPELLRRREDRRILELLTSEENLHEEVEIDLRDRGTLAVEVKTAVLRDARQRVRGVIGVFVDATLTRRVAEMETRLARLEGVEEMALGIAHEIRNPLASIRGAVQELVPPGDARWTDDDRKLADIVRRESDRLDKIVGEFLSFARARPPERTLHDVGKLVEETALLLAKRDDAKEFDVSATIDGGPNVASIDVGQIKQVLLNVGINALEAMKKGEPLTPGSRARSELRMAEPLDPREPPPERPPEPRPRPQRGRLTFILRRSALPARSELPGGGRLLASRQGVDIIIEDDGPGIPYDLRGKIFLPFFTTKKTGLGLGLAIAQKIVRDHGGDIACEAAASGGARFRITLPLPEAEPISARSSPTFPLPRVLPASSGTAGSHPGAVA
jgi:two-component system sensor histidine kinase PilS (NtrC family)